MCRSIRRIAQVVPMLRDHLEVLGVGGSFEASYLPRFQASFKSLHHFVCELVAK
ncbi:MAG: hypothetical protein QM734_05725 [Cyclobacteriaceae bacterium]